MSFFDLAATRELTRLVESLMTGRAALTRPGGEAVETTPGTYVNTSEVVATDEPVSFTPANAPREVVAADAAQSVVDYLLKFRVGTVVTPDMEVTIIADDPSVPVLSMEVIGPYYKSTEFSRWVRARLVTPGGL